MKRESVNFIRDLLEERIPPGLRDRRMPRSQDQANDSAACIARA